MLAESWRDVEAMWGDSKATRYAFLIGANAALGAMIESLESDSSITAIEMAKSLNDELKALLSKL